MSSSSLFDFEPKTDRYVVMGNPVSLSKSPFIHAEFARQTSQNIEYTAAQVDPGGFDQAVGNFQATGGKGLNVTVPFKQEAWSLVNERSDRAEIAGAVNTIVFNQDGSLYGDNTDGIGLIIDIIKNNNGEIANKRILILGAGGAVRGILLPLLDQQPSEIIIANRTIDRATNLAKHFSNKGQVSGCSYNELAGRKFDFIINGTSASLNNELPPLPDNILANNAWCYDLMYAKEPTVFLQWAANNNAEKMLDGLGMLVEQAAESFHLWRNVLPETGSVIKKLRSQLTGN